VADHCAAIHHILHADLPPIPAGAVTDPGLLPIFDISARYEVTNLNIVHQVLASTPVSGSNTSPTAPTTTAAT
jgi:dTDP-glucose 4,6-dehydratase